MPRKINNIEILKKGMEKAIAMKNATIMEALRSIAENAIRVASDTHTFDNQTHNLEDSFSYGIYHNGLLVTKESIGASKGVADAENFLQNYSTSLTWAVVIVAGAKYGQRLEGYVRKTDGKLSKAGDSLIVLNESFIFVTAESLSYFNRKK